MRPVAGSRTSVVNEALTIFQPPLAVAPAFRLWHGVAMQARTSRAGGFFLTACIIAGLVLGIVFGQPVTGAMLGAIAGIAIAVLVWLVDRRRDS